MAIQIKSTKKEAATELKLGVFGQSGTGKTSLAKTLPCKEEEVLIIDIEGGLEVVRKNDFASIRYADLEGSPEDRMREIVRYLHTPEGINGFKWLVTDSYTELCEKILQDHEKNWEKYGHINKYGKFDKRSMYGDVKIIFSKIHKALLDIPGLHKMMIYAAHEKGDEEKRMEVMIPGSFSDAVMFHLDEFYALRVVKDGKDTVRELVVNSDGYYVTKSRMDGGAGGVLGVYEPADIGALIAKCYGTAPVAKAPEPVKPKLVSQKKKDDCVNGLGIQYELTDEDKAILVGDMTVEELGKFYEERMPPAQQQDEKTAAEEAMGV